MGSLRGLGSSCRQLDYHLPSLQYPDGLLVGLEHFTQELEGTP